MYRPVYLFIVWDVIIHPERKVYHRDRIYRWWDMPVELLPLRHQCVEGHSGWGRGAVYWGLVPYPHLDPCLSNNRWIVCNEGFH